MRCQSIPSLCLCSNNVVDALICLIDLILLILQVSNGYEQKCYPNGHIQN